MSEKMTIGKLAEKSKVNVETIRFYERRGILQQPKKLGTFRVYPVDYVAKIQFVKRAQELGFTLRETTELLELRIQDQAECRDVLDRTEEKIREIGSKINDLKRMKKSLMALTDCCEDKGISLSDCPVLDCFMSDNKGLK